MVTSHCALHRKDSLCALARWFCVSRNGGTRGDGWGHLQGVVHMVAARLGFEKAMVVICRVLYTWWLLYIGLALKRPWLVPGGPPHAMPDSAWTGLENTTLTLQRAGER